MGIYGHPVGRYGEWAERREKREKKRGRYSLWRRRWNKGYMGRRQSEREKWKWREYRLARWGKWYIIPIGLGTVQTPRIPTEGLKHHRGNRDGRARDGFKRPESRLRD